MFGSFIDRRLERFRFHIYVATFTATLLLLLLWPMIAKTVLPGQTGVKYSRLFGGTIMDRIYGEGIHFILPWDEIYIYNTRIQEISQTVNVLTRDGLSVQTEVSIRFHIDKKRLPFLHRFVGPEYREKLIIPVLTASVRETVGSYRPFELYSVAREKIQNDIIVEAIEDISRIPLVVDRIVVKRFHLPESLNTAIQEKLVAEQRLLRYEYLLKQAREEYKRMFIEGSAIRTYQGLVNQGMTDQFLRFKGIEATRELAASDNAKVVVVGGRDGLPLILNLPPDRMTNATMERRLSVYPPPLSQLGARAGLPAEANATVAGGSVEEAGDWEGRAPQGAGELPDELVHRVYELIDRYAPDYTVPTQEGRGRLARELSGEPAPGMGSDMGSGMSQGPRADVRNQPTSPADMGEPFGGGPRR